MKRIKKAGVIGAGVMGSNIAAQLSNVGVDVLLLDMVPVSGLTQNDREKGLTEQSPEFRNRLAKTGIDLALLANPPAYYVPENAKGIVPLNLEDHLGSLGEVDWIIEVVTETLEIKRAVFEKIESVMGPETLISSNTSGISAAALCEGRAPVFQKNFCITHFFNPPRQMKLLEIIPGPKTSANTTDTLAEFCERVMGKGIVWAKDTPNFVANRIGVYSSFAALRAMERLDISVEAVDMLTGPVIGRPKSASFRTADLVGLDTLVHVADNVSIGASEDPDRDGFKAPAFVKKMVEKNLLGQKSGQGFYKKSVDAEGKKQFLSIDCKTLEYKPVEKVRIFSVKAAKDTPGTGNKIRTLYYADDVGGQFTFQTLSETLVYAAHRIPEISDDLLNVDNALKWGFGWTLGPFETWDALGLATSVEKMKAAGYVIPPWVQEMLDGGSPSFYLKKDGKQHYYDPSDKQYKPFPERPGVILLPALKERNRLVAGNENASIIDLGDGVACLEFHAKMNALGNGTVKMIHKAVDIVTDDFDGLVIANHGTNFSAGANLALVLITAQCEDWHEIDYMLLAIQGAFMRLKYMDKPVVAAPAGMALGGGCEICLHSDRVRYAAEAYIGLVEVGVGIIPAAGGTKEMLLRCTEGVFDVQPGGIYPNQIDLMPFVAKAFETIAMAKVSTSGPDAVRLGYLHPKTSSMTVNRDFHIEDAKRTVLAMNMEGYVPPKPLDQISVGGKDAYAILDSAMWNLHKAGFVSEHDITVSSKVANVLCGGDVPSGTKVSEQHLLDLEREGFISLCGEPATRARMLHMLKTGKPLRN